MSSLCIAAVAVSQTSTWRNRDLSVSYSLWQIFEFTGVMKREISVDYITQASNSEDKLRSSKVLKKKNHPRNNG